MKVPYIVSCTLWLLSFVGLSLGADTPRLPRLPGSALLVGYDSLFSGSPSLFLAVSTSAATFLVLPEPGQPETRNDFPTYPNISPDGRLVACLRVRLDDPPRVAVATYSVPEKKWREYTEVSFSLGATVFEVPVPLGVAISPGKSQLAVVSAVKRGDQPRLYIIDTRTGASRVATTEPFPLDGHLSWSPDGVRLAYQVRLSSGAADKYEAAINVLDLATGASRRVATGQDPSWSPSGEWIAYLDSSGTWPVATKCMAVRPDGTEEQVLYAFRRSRSNQRYFIGPPVWSPDSRQLVLNEPIDLEESVVNGRMNIHMLDLSTRSLTTKFRKAAPILGWAAWK